MKNKLLSPELLQKLVRYDPETGKIFWRKRPEIMFATRGHAGTWNTRFAEKEAFTAHDNAGYRVGKICGKSYRAHRVAWAVQFGSWPEDQVDHINGNPSDNRLENLREVDHAENAKNRAIGSDSTSGVMGVCWYKRDSKWMAHIRENGKFINLGCFNDFHDAVSARKAAEAKHGFHKHHGRMPA